MGGGGLGGVGMGARGGECLNFMGGWEAFDLQLIWLLTISCHKLSVSVQYALKLQTIFYDCTATKSSL